MGPPGAGKGTQAQMLERDLGVRHLSTGEMLRAAAAQDTDQGRLARAYMSRGELVPDDLVIELLTDALRAEPGFVLDGFPRTPTQAQALDKVLTDIGSELDAAVLLQVPDSEVIGRILTRRATAAKPRDDDLQETVRRRLGVYRQQTAPVADYYRRNGLLRCVDGSLSPSDVYAQILAALDRTQS